MMTRWEEELQVEIPSSYSHRDQPAPALAVVSEIDLGANQVGAFGAFGAVSVTRL